MQSIFKEEIVFRKNPTGQSCQKVSCIRIPQKTSLTSNNQVRRDQRSDQKLHEFRAKSKAFVHAQYSFAKHRVIIGNNNEQQPNNNRCRTVYYKCM
jgi:hypothetical protein